jgi:hypothetical protein
MQQILVKFTNLKSHENPARLTRFAPCSQLGGQTAKLVVASPQICKGAK